MHEALPSRFASDAYLTLYMALIIDDSAGASMKPRNNLCFTTRGGIGPIHY